MEKKREGAGRDKRLSSLHHRSGAPPPLFRIAHELLSKGAVSRVGVFERPNATEKLLRQVCESGLEIQGYSRALVVETGRSPKGHVATALKILLPGLHPMTCYDKSNVTELAVGEHFSRRIL